MTDKPYLKNPLGATRRWRDGDILYAENDLFLGAYVVTDDPAKLGQTTWHGPKEINCEYISAETGKLWDSDAANLPRAKG